MNPEELFTPEAISKFEAEGIDSIYIYLLKNTEVVRDIKVDLHKKDNKLFCVAGRTLDAAAVLKKHFCSFNKDGREWYPFHAYFKMSKESPETTLADIANRINIEPAYLEWALIEEETAS
jgi:hypothetical protein